ncbi:NAD(P)-binding protein [Mycena rosella]|uniref:NAD(P)-binding protein n=1 Tax=Mycena rosella TaxID=1033263 RepID=A0AAD7G700_MYCRO|nr:NAD(P)-binding protein [Mycena rosella]
MTITQNLSAPLVAVVGATGTQGGSVIRALEESDKPYRIRGFTRDATKPAAQQLVAKGVEIVAIQLVVANKEAVFKAFAGANMAFLVTNFWEHITLEKEVSEAKMLIDAVKAAAVERVVWSGLTSASKASAGKYTHVIHFDGKAEIAEYGRQSGVPFVDVQAGFYASNFLDSPMMLAKQDDGSFTIELPTKPTTVVPIIDTAQDYGLYVRQVLELPVFPDGSEVLTAGENISVEDIALQFSQATGKKIVFKQITPAEFGNVVAKLGLPAYIVQDMQECFGAFDEFGYYGGKATTSHDGLARKPRTWAEFIATADWSKALA